MNKINKNINSKKLTAVMLVVFMLISNLAFFSFPATADDLPDISISRINIPSSVQSGDGFEVTVTVKNNTSDKIDGVKVSTSNTGAGTLTTSNDVEKSIDANSESVYSFYFKAGSSASVYDITFAASYNGTEITETRSITITAPPAVVAQPPRFELLTEIYPKTAAVGDVIKIAFRFANMGGVASGVRVSVEPQDGDSIESRTVAKTVGIMTTNQNYYCEFDFKIKESAKAGLNKFTINITCADSSANYSYEIGVMLEKSTVEEVKNNPNINVISTEIPADIKKGEKFKIKAVLENSGTADAANVTVTAVYPAGINPLSPKEIKIDSIKSGEKKEVVFEAEIAKTIAAQYHAIDIQVDYNIVKDGEPEKESKTHKTGLLVLADEEEEEEKEPEIIKDFTINVNIPDIVKIGENFKVSFTVTNNGTEQKYLYAKVTPQVAGVENRTNNNIFIPILKPGESVTKEVVFNASKDAAGKELKYCSFEISLTGGSDVNFKQYTGTLIPAFEEKEKEEEKEKVSKIIIDSIKAPQNVNIGDTFDVAVTVANTGDADAENIILTVVLPNGILNKTASTVKINSVRSGGKTTRTFTFIVTQNASYGYNAFNVDASDASEKTNQFFGVTVNSSDLRIEAVRIPNSVGVDIDFNMEVEVINTGADTTGVEISISSMGGFINKTSNKVKIDSIKSGETVVKTFTFMATQSSPNGYNAIDITLTHGEDIIRQYSGTVVKNPPKEGADAEDKRDIPVVIISNFSYTNIGDDTSAENNNNNDSNMGDRTDTDSGLSPGSVSEKEMFRKTSAVAAADAPIAIMPAPASPDYSGDGSYGNYGDFGGSESSEGSEISSPIADTNAVYGGKTFIFTIELFNTHKSVAVKDLKVTISQEKGIFNPKSGSNTFFVELLNPRETTEISIPLLVKADVVPDSYGLTITLSYKSESGESSMSSEIINIPVKQEIRFSAGDLTPINDIEMGDEAYTNIQCVNLGKSTIYSVIVRVQGDGFMSPDAVFYAGDIPGGTVKSREFSLVPYMSGPMNGTFIYTYEDADGNTFQEEQAFSFNVYGGEESMDAYPTEDVPVIGPEGEEESGGFWLFTDMDLMKWALTLAGGAVIIAAVAGIIVAIVKKAKKKKEKEDDDEA